MRKVTKKSKKAETPLEEITVKLRVYGQYNRDGTHNFPIVGEKFSAGASHYRVRSYDSPIRVYSDHPSRKAIDMTLVPEANNLANYVVEALHSGLTFEEWHARTRDWDDWEGEDESADRDWAESLAARKAWEEGVSAEAYLARRKKIKELKAEIIKLEEGKA